jgi:hypothetical protein
MLTKNIQLEIPTHIFFTLYKYDYIDSIIITRVLNECQNLSSEEGVYTIDIEEFKEVISSSVRLKVEASKVSTGSIKQEKYNTINFLWTIFNSLTNIELVSFKISNDKEYSRMIKFKGQELLNFYYKIIEGCLDLTKILTVAELDEFNMAMINTGLLTNNHLSRQSYFYINIVKFLDLITNFELNININSIDVILDVIDPKLEEDDPILIIKTDYTLY